MAKSKNTESAKLSRPTLITGGWVDGNVEVYPFQRRHMVDAGYVNGNVEDIASEGEKDAGALEVLKKAEDRKDIDGGAWSVDRVFNENDVGQGAEGQPNEDQGSSKSAK